MANRNFPNGKSIYIPRVKPVLVDCNFIVDDTNGLGIRSLNGPYVQNVFMHTTTTPSAGNSNPASLNVVVTNPNPEAGTIVLQLQDNYNRSLASYKAMISALSGSPLTATTANVSYVITALGTASAAQWQAKGLPRGITPAIGVAFVASASGTIGGSAAVQVASAAGSGIASIEVLGNPSLTLSPNVSQSQGFGGQIILQCRDYAGSIAAPAAGSVISIALYLDDSSVRTSAE